MLRPRPVSRALDPIKLLIANLKDDDRRWLRAWILRWVGEDGSLQIPGAPPSGSNGTSPVPIGAFTARSD